MPPGGELDGAVGAAAGHNPAERVRALWNRCEICGGADAEAYTEVVFEQWAARSRHDWTLDCSVLEVQGIQFNPTRT